MPASPAPFRPADPAQRRVWVLGSFSMTGGVLTTHAVQVAADLKTAVPSVMAVSFHPGAFAHASLNDVDVETADGIIYLRSLLRLAGGRARLRGWARRLRRLARLARASNRVVLVGGGTLPERACAVALRLMARRGFEHVPLRCPPATLARRLAPTAETAQDAEATLLGDIAQKTGAGPRLTEQHVERAMRGASAQTLCPETREDILSLSRAARTADRVALKSALDHWLRQTATAQDRARQAAFAPGQHDPRLPRIAEHLRRLKSHRRVWRSFIQPSPPPDTATDLGSVVLRHLIGQSKLRDADVLAELRKPLTPLSNAPTRLEWFLLLALRVPAPDIDALRAPWASPGLLNYVRPPKRPAPPGLHLIGHAANSTGLAQNFWMSARALQAADLSPHLRALDAPVGSLQTLPAASKTAVQKDVSLYHLNADRIPQSILDRPYGHDSFNIGFLLWELDRLPREHQLALDMLDEIWVPSMFLRRVYQRYFDRKVIFMRKGISLPKPAPWPAASEGVTRFLVCFDQRSSVARKNPLAAVRAFQAGFPGRRDVELIVKTTPVPQGHWGDPEQQMSVIRAMSAVDPRIRLIERDLPFADLLGLVASADCLVSPHRAEGFGYVPAFALSLGVPVVVTDHSGTQDFCTPLTSDPVPADLVPVPEQHAIYRAPGARWAEVDREALAAALQNVVANPHAARARAEAGRLLIETDYSMTAHARRYRNRLAELGLLAPSATPPATVTATLD